MRTRSCLSRTCQLAPAIGLLVMACTGCWSPPAEFQFNWVHLEVRQQTEPELVEASENQRRNVAEILEATFGTPQDPRLPGSLPDVNVDTLVEFYNLKMAAGPVGRDEVSQEPRGLFRRHCAHCHGVTGDGMGPTARFLNPYPRDYRAGIFKFKLTKGLQKPSKADLMRTLRKGIPGTAMPSFRVLPEDELSALVDYVIYLSLRGEVERELIGLLEDGDPEGGGSEGALILDPKDKENYGDVKEMIGLKVEDWLNTEPLEIKMYDGTKAWWHKLNNGQLNYDSQAARDRKLKGLELFRGKAGCVKCHGDTALGDGQAGNYDKWTEPIVDLNAGTPEGQLEPYWTFYHQYGALLPRPIRPRNLRQGVYRGGRRPIDLYHRISQGINGTPMPNQEQTLTPDEIWSLVFYVRSLPFEHASQPAGVRNLERVRPN